MGHPLASTASLMSCSTLVAAFEDGTRQNPTGVATDLRWIAATLRSAMPLTAERLLRLVEAPVAPFDEAGAARAFAALRRELGSLPAAALELVRGALPPTNGTGLVATVQPPRVPSEMVFSVEGEHIVVDSREDVGRYEVAPPPTDESREATPEKPRAIPVAGGLQWLRYHLAELADSAPVAAEAIAASNPGAFGAEARRKLDLWIQSALLAENCSDRETRTLLIKELIGEIADVRGIAPREGTGPRSDAEESPRPSPSEPDVYEVMQQSAGRASIPRGTLRAILDALRGTVATVVEALRVLAVEPDEARRRALANRVEPVERLLKRGLCSVADAHEYLRKIGFPIPGEPGVAALGTRQLGGYLPAGAPLPLLKGASE